MRNRWSFLKWFVTKFLTAPSNRVGFYVKNSEAIERLLLDEESSGFSDMIYVMESSGLRCHDVIQIARLYNLSLQERQIQGQNLPFQVWVNHLEELSLRLKDQNKSVKDIGELVPDGRQIYSQDGEDAVLARFFDGQDQGLFVDVGAHHPVKHSNTFLFYKKGWRGINIEPTPGSKLIFDRERPEDKNLELAVTEVTQEMDFYLMSDSALNTVDPSYVKEMEKNRQGLKTVVKVPGKTLRDILEENLNPNSKIDFMTVDVETHEMQVLKSNDWSRFRPRILLIEILDMDIRSPQTSEVHRFIEGQTYQLIAKTYNTAFYLDVKSES